MSTVHGVHDIRRLNIPFCQVLETGRRENQRPVNPGARHTEMVYKSECGIKWSGGRQWTRSALLVALSIEQLGGSLPSYVSARGFLFP